jgi:uncharacterized protein YcbK (DUF882 family)
MRIAALCLLLLLRCPPPSAGSAEITAADLMERMPDLIGSVPEPPEITEDQVMALEEDDPETHIFINRALARPPRPARLGGDGRLRLIRPDTREKISAAYRRPDGSYDRRELERLDRLLRCRFTGKHAEMPARLIEILDAVEDRFGGRPLVVMSGYRTPAVNKHVPGAARWSLHMLGWAADIRIAGTPTEDIARFAAGLKAGGVGHYPDSGFVHIDAGRARRWEKRGRSAGQAGI